MSIFGISISLQFSSVAWPGTSRSARRVVEPGHGFRRIRTASSARQGRMAREKADDRVSDGTNSIAAG
jgi:hypothetical protein